MGVSTELLAILVTIACSVMGVNMYVMKALWEDIKKVKKDQADLRVEMATKMDMRTGCSAIRAQCQKEIKDLFSSMITKMEMSIRDIKSDNDEEHKEMWERINHHAHGPDGKVQI